MAVRHIQQMFQLIFPIAHSQRIMRIAETDHLRMFRHIILNVRKIDVPVLHMRRVAHGCRTCVIHACLEQKVHRIKDNRLIPRLQDRLRRNEHAPGRRINRQNLGRINVFSLSFLHCPGNTLLERIKAPGRRIAEITPVDILLQRLTDFRRRLEIRVRSRQRKNTLRHLSPPVIECPLLQYRKINIFIAKLHTLLLPLVFLP